MKTISTILILFLTLLSLKASTENDTTKSVFITLKAGTSLSLEVMETLSSESAIVGTIIHFSVYKQKTVDGDVIFNDKCLGQGKITRVGSPKSFGRGGFIEFEMESIETADGEQIHVAREKFVIKGVNRKAFAWVLSSALPTLGLSTLTPSGLLLIPFFSVGFLVDGYDAELQKGNIFSAYTTEDIVLKTKAIKIKTFN